MSGAEHPGPLLRIIIGPTAAGKSALAMSLAERFGLTIISADSRQVYRGFDIGTAKPSPDDQARVRHEGIDVIDPTERYSAHQFAADAIRWRVQAAGRGQDVVIVGGTGFYVRSLVQPLAATPALDPVRRAELARWMTSLDARTLQRWCARLDPPRAALGSAQQRRAVETALLSGQRISDALRAGQDASPFTVRYLLVDPGATLSTRIAERVRLMAASGWLEEIRHLAATVPIDAPAWQASGYRVLRDAVVAGDNVDAAIERVTIETRQYAKRQRTWFRHQVPAARTETLDPSVPDAAERAARWWESTDRSCP